MLPAPAAFPLPLAQEPDPSSPLRHWQDSLLVGVFFFGSSAEVGQAFDTSGVFSARGETPAARASVKRSDEGDVCEEALCG